MVVAVVLVDSIILIEVSYHEEANVQKSLFMLQLALFLQSQ